MPAADSSNREDAHRPQYLQPPHRTRSERAFSGSPKGNRGPDVTVHSGNTYDLGPIQCWVFARSSGSRLAALRTRGGSIRMARVRSRLCRSTLPVEAPLPEEK